MRADTYTMFYMDRFGRVLFIRENVTAAERARLLADPRWITAS